MAEGLNVLVTIASDENVETGRMIEKLLQINGVVEAFELSGGLDIMLRASTLSAGEMNRIMETIKATEGVKSANSYLILGRKP